MAPPPFPQGVPTVEQAVLRAIELERQGRVPEAAELYRTILQAQPNDFEALHRLGLIRYAQGQPAEALKLIEAAIASNPKAMWPLSNRALVLHALGRTGEAVASFDKALAIEPAFPEAHNNRGNVLRDAGRHAEALASYERALALRPDFVEAHNNRGNVLQDLQRHDDAVASYDRALALEPGRVQTLHNRGAALQALNRHADAVASYQRALAIEPGNADIHWSESLARLMLGDYAEGFRKFEWRWRTSDSTVDWPRFPQPLWLGREPLPGKTILLYSEQGLGDTLQFVRYVPLVAARGGNVILAVHSQIKPLVADITGAAAVFGEDETLPPFDVQCPLFSLPLAFGTTPATIPADVPYLRAPADRMERWKAHIPRSHALRVGLVWAGNLAHTKLLYRSIDFEQLAPLLGVPDVQFVCLQKEMRPADGDGLRRHPGILNPGAEFADFADTAAVISELDLVVTIDTAVAHLAGALGKPLWIMLSYSPDWRWFLHRDDSPWYPTARLYRQQQRGDWAGVVARVAQDLARLRDAQR